MNTPIAPSASIHPEETIYGSSQALSERRNELIKEIQNNNSLPLLQLDSSQLQEQISSRWKELDFESISIPPEKQSLFKTQGEKALIQIHTFILQTIHSTDFSSLQNNELRQDFFWHIQENINSIWEKEMQILGTEPLPSFQDFSEALLETFSETYNTQLDDIEQYLDEAEESVSLQKTKDEFFAKGGTPEQWKEFVSSPEIHFPLPPALQKIKSEFLSQGRSQDEWDALVHEFKTRKATEKKEYNEMKAMIQQRESEKKITLPPGAKYYESIVGKVPLLERFDGTESTDDYIAITAESILNESHTSNTANKPPLYSFLTSGEPFYEVIQFLRNETNTLSPEGYKTMQTILKGSKRRDQHKQWVDKKVNKLSQYQSSGSDDPRHDKKSIKQKRLQQKIGKSNHLYQLAMYRIAQKAQERITGKESEILGLDPQSVEALKNTAQSDGYEVKNKHTNQADGTLSAQYAGRFTLENLVLDQVVRSAGMLMAVANLLIAIKSKNWKSSLPYIGAGVMMTGGLAQGVFNSGIDRIRYPDRMLNNIINESLNNEHYRMYFKNEWEVALLQSITWPKKQNKHTMKQDLRNIEEENEIKTIDDNTVPDGKREITKMPGFLNPEGKIRDEMEQSLSISDFSLSKKSDNPESKTKPSGIMSKYLGEGSFLGPDGRMYPRDQFLEKIEQNGIQNENIRYRMFRNISERIGSSASFIPYFNQLHHYYAFHEEGKTKAQHENINNQLANLSNKVQYQQ